MSSRARSALIGLLAGILIALAYRAAPDLGGLERLTGDSLSRSVAARLNPSDEILILTIDDRSLTALEPEFGRWPLDRELMARLIEEARIGGAKVVAFDILFTGENRQGGAGDARFAAAMQSMPVVLATQTVPAAGANAGAEGWPLRGPEPDQLMATRGPWPGFEPSAGIGTIRLSTDGRTYVLHDPVDPARTIPSLAMATAAAARSWPREVVHTPAGVAIGPHVIEPDRGRRMLIRWKDKIAGAEGEGEAEQSRGREGRSRLAFDVVNLDQVLVASFAREDPSMGVPQETLDEFSRRFRDKVVVVGFTASGLVNDFRSTPLATASPGVEIHAMALDNLLTGDFNRQPPFWAMLLALGAAGILTGLILSIIESRWISGAVIALLALLIVGGGWLALLNGWVIPVAGPLLTLALTWGAVTAVDYIEERRRSVQLQSTFGRYVSPQILDYLLAHPEKVELGGERRDLTILFSDIRGFTTISEASEPEEVVEMLNEYLTSMVDILLRHDGTLDKFIGDAVMGFWNAPAEVENHPTRAVACAVEMIEETARLRERWENEGKPALRIGIGVHTGEAVVGNIGSERVFGYTVIGDTVNLASRLEGKNKEYGTEIIISESTLERLEGSFDVTYLDEVKVKGKENAVRIFQVRGQS